MLDVAAAVIVNTEGKILITQRSKEDNLSLKWEFPRWEDRKRRNRRGVSQAGDHGRVKS